MKWVTRKRIHVNRTEAAAREFVIKTYGADKDMVEHAARLERHLAQMALAKETR